MCLRNLTTFVNTNVKSAVNVIMIILYFLSNKELQESLFLKKKCSSIFLFACPFNVIYIMLMK